MSRCATRGRRGNNAVARHGQGIGCEGGILDEVMPVRGRKEDAVRCGAVRGASEEQVESEGRIYGIWERNGVLYINVHVAACNYYCTWCCI